MIKTDQRLSIQDKGLAEVQENFDLMLTKLLDCMKEKGTDEATLTLRLKVELNAVQLDSPDGIQNITVPIFKHNISSVMTVKDSVSGSSNGDKALVYDSVCGEYVLREIYDGQLEFDGYDEYDEDDE